MILQALVEYYEVLAAQGKITKPGWCQAKISFALDLDAEGNLMGIIPLHGDPEIRGKKTIISPQNLLLPEATKRTSNIVAKFLWDNAQYILGLDTPQNQAKATKCFAATADKCQQILQNAKGRNAVAVKKFFAKWNPDAAATNEVLQIYNEELLGAVNLTFTVEGEKINEDAEIVQAWNAYNTSTTSEYCAYCLVTGKKAPIARLHPDIKGVRNAQPSGAPLVAFNEPAYESYGHKQGLNAPVSEYAASAYTTVLNNLVADERHCQQIGDMTVVFWAEGADEVCANIFGGFLADKSIVKDEDLKDFFTQVNKGLPFELEGLVVHPENKFYVLGISPNNARLSIRFFLVQTFGKFIENLKKFYEDFAIIRPSFDEKENLPLWIILQETANKNAKDKSATPLLAGSFLRSILSGTPYPESLYENIILRAKADQDNPDKFITKISRIKAAVIKAFLKYEKYDKCEEVATVALNEESKNVPYVLGRLFAVLEHLQETANPGINSTIKDRYFNSACATPAVVFTILLKLANHYLRKLSGEKKITVYFEKQTGQLLDKINIFPDRLNLKEQGAFMLGYYHQVQKRYEKKEEK